MALKAYLTLIDDHGEDYQVEFPGKRIVCHDCEGEGYVLRESMRYHAYTQEEFYESFDDEEERAEYFKRGGRYDVQCPTCKGANVITVVDTEAEMTEEQTEALQAYAELMEEQYHSDLERAAERRAGC